MVSLDIQMWFMVFWKIIRKLLEEHLFWKYLSVYCLYGPKSQTPDKPQWKSQLPEKEGSYALWVWT